MEQKLVDTVDTVVEDDNKAEDLKNIVVTAIRADGVADVIATLREDPMVHHFAQEGNVEGLATYILSKMKPDDAKRLMEKMDGFKTTGTHKPTTPDVKSPE